MDIPPDSCLIAPDDVLLVQNVLTAMKSLATGENATCSKYKVDNIPTGYLIRATLPASEHFELHLDDFLFLQAVSPSRIEQVAVARRPPASLELLVRLLDFKQRICIASTVSFYSHATRKRKWMDC